MAWRVQSRTEPGRWAAHDGERWTADEVTRPEMRLSISGPQPLTPTGPMYDPAGPDDEVAIYLAAWLLIPAPETTGTPPRLPRPEGDILPGVVY